ncbi:MAG TPA: hypothetical protein H9910_10140 [Candidatus Mediterraneibacter quadrami]|uniref:Putative Flagellin Flp1-like domain-containing protein n=1 Tax=Candidatus Mediterraneibacter quadrami TaxID=2838684 RepID=A0A9D2U873_9FIRM|nr:hypothetical protein [Candidatus Mediterraneibacter quadrami]
MKARAVRERWITDLCRRSLSGITVIELVLILVIVIALLLIFKNQLINLINTIFDKIISESSGI